MHKTLLTLLLSSWTLGALAAAPTVVSVATSSTATASTTHSMLMPGSMTNGNLVCGAIGTTHGYAFASPLSWPSGWVKVAGQSVTGTMTETAEVRCKTVDGTEGSSITITATGSGKAQMWAAEISGATAAPKGSVVLGTTATVNPDPPSLYIPPNTAYDYLWLAIAFPLADSTASGYPTNYISDQHTASTSGLGANIGIGLASRTTFAFAENPGPLTVTTSAKHISLTIGIR